MSAYWSGARAPAARRRWPRAPRVEGRQAGAAIPRVAAPSSSFVQPRGSALAASAKGVIRRFSGALRVPDPPVMAHPRLPLFASGIRAARAAPDVGMTGDLTIIGTAVLVRRGRGVMHSPTNTAIPQVVVAKLAFRGRRRTLAFRAHLRSLHVVLLLESMLGPARFAIPHVVVAGFALRCWCRSLALSALLRLMRLVLFFERMGGPARIAIPQAIITELALCAQ